MIIPFGGVEVDLIDEPRLSKAQSCRKQVIVRVRHFLCTEFANPSEGGRTQTQVKRSQRVNRRSSGGGTRTPLPREKEDPNIANNALIMVSGLRLPVKPRAPAAPPLRGCGA